MSNAARRARAVRPIANFAERVCTAKNARVARNEGNRRNANVRARLTEVRMSPRQVFWAGELPGRQEHHLDSLSLQKMIHTIILRGGLSVEWRAEMTVDSLEGMADEQYYF